ncbi:hypothetical protein EK904_014978 [Melospiza melodia maxima]|nr:hypothetical protein EK904_014978 [Melospiza melodia maxima]
MELHHAKCFSFVDNTYVSSSDNDEDVLVTTEPIPVIFHQIATGLVAFALCLSHSSLASLTEEEEAQRGNPHLGLGRVMASEKAPKCSCLRSHDTAAQLKKTLKEIMTLRNFIMEDR